MPRQISLKEDRIFSCLLFWCRWPGIPLLGEMSLGTKGLRSSARKSEPARFDFSCGSNAKREVSVCYLLFLMVPLAGVASLEPPAKQSTGLFFRLRRTRKQVCSLLIRLRPLKRHRIKEDKKISCLLLLVPLAGVEPARYHYHWILSPARLPISPQRHFIIKFVAKLKYFW